MDSNAIAVTGVETARPGTAQAWNAVGAADAAQRQPNATGGRGVALVFGGSRGIGAAIAGRLAQDGYDVAITYVSRPDSADGVVAAVGQAGRRGLAIQADSADLAARPSALWRWTT